MKFDSYTTPIQVPEPGDRLRTFYGVDSQHFLNKKDGTSLCYRRWQSNGSEKSIVLVLHGIGNHSRPYEVVADTLNKHGMTVYACDTRGHGLSSGPKGDVPRGAELCSDIRSIIELIRTEHPGKKLFLAGDSMGGAFALAFAAQPDAATYLDGLVLFAPALRLQLRQFLKLRNVALLPYLFLWQTTPAVSLVDDRLEESSRDQQFISYRREDPLAYKVVSISYLMGIAALANRWKSHIAPLITVPTLVCHGRKDPLIDPEGSRLLYRLLGSKDKSLCFYDDVPHTLLWDPETPHLLEDTAKWILLRGK